MLPEFVVLTGDIVDASNELGIPVWQYQDEWDDYRGVVDGYGVDLTFWHDVCGNHDTYLDAGATHFLGNSLTGSTQTAWHDTWIHAFPFGDYLFIALNTADTSGPIPGFDSVGLSPDELDHLEQALIDHEDADLAFLFTHHPLPDLDFGDSELLDLLEDHGVSLWANGHVHAHSETFVDGTLHFNLDSLGKADSDNVALFAVDHDGVAARAIDLGNWPLVLITAPVDGALGGLNPYAYPVSGGRPPTPFGRWSSIPSPCWTRRWWSTAARTCR